MNKKRVLSGTRATGKLHLGNYLGAVKGYIELSENPEYETFYMVADLHVLTTPYDKDKLQDSIRSVVLDYLSAGLNPEKCSIFIQSHVPEHTELFYLLSSVVSVARMQHLPTFKEKVKQYPQNSTMALLNYPVLMASDILIYKANAVPVGDDQLPHLEVAREIARKMNDLYGTDFPEPTQFKTKGAYVPSLTGEGKMSKTIEGSYINLVDNLVIIEAKLAKVPTDSGKGNTIPKTGGVASLLTLVGLFQGPEKLAEYESEYTSGGIKYSELKQKLAEAIYKELEPIQKRRTELENDEFYVENILKEGTDKARSIASQTVKEVKEKMGLI
jgi:tryptophanyl-tRNA synthetase